MTYIQTSKHMVRCDNNDPMLVTTGADEAMPYVWVQMYQESEFYTGYLKGKTIYLPLEMLYDLIDGLNDLSEECDKRKIE